MLEGKPNDNLAKDIPLSLQEAVSEFRVLKASDLLRMKTFERQQDLEIEWMKPKDCLLLLFISHRWEKLEHPDPEERQLIALKLLIRFICDAAEAFSAQSNEERLRYMPSLRRYGALQASILLSRISLSNIAAETHYKKYNEKPAYEWLPEHIGIWYDFACLPQKPRSLEQEKEFKNALKKLPNLLQSEEISLIALREADDDYELRGWCFAEARLASKKMFFAPLVLRLDRLETMFDYCVLGRTAADTNDNPTLQFETALAVWEDTSSVAVALDKCWETVVLQACSCPDMLPMPEEDSPMLGLSKFSNPAGTWVSLLVADMARQGDQSFDFSDVILRLLQEKGLHCSEDNDLVYVGLLSLLWSCGEHSRLREFFRQCLDRYVKNKSLLMQVTMSHESCLLESKYVGSFNSDNLNWTFVENL
jgi:hypothetical protein